MAPAQMNSFQFGIEIEVLVRSLGKQHGTWATLSKELSRRLKSVGVPNSIQGNDNYREWSIVRELTVQSDNPYDYGVELVSPIYAASSLSALHDDLQKIFTALINPSSSSSNKHKHYYTLLPTPQCSSHVHISSSSCTHHHHHPYHYPSPCFSPTELAGLAKAALYFEHALDQLMPPERRDGEAYWAKSNRSRDNPSLAGLSLAQCLAKIDTAVADPCGDIRPIIEVMNLYSKDTNFARARGRRADFIRGKTYRWNLAGLLAAAGERKAEDMDCGGLGTIEFRQPPGSLTAEDAMSWATLAVAFVAAGVAYGRELGRGEDTVTEVWRGEEGGSLAELWEFLKGGCLALGWDELVPLRVLFARTGLDVDVA
ncbi:uncharacterized protein B0T15DRAFT_563143 [Chaetomium strumarium]|uniref:Uncharacterized protein n=1 Tax=Chaetomium strumarium TaxID=1170767 RepID=A0AAJ0GKN5_9PEZI|nr:hypothetical protein B0T15DRAFT_563143 [Chaetomium strumarium]